MQRNTGYSYAEFQAALADLTKKYKILPEDSNRFMMEMLFKKLNIQMNPATRRYISSNCFTWKDSANVFIIKADSTIPLGEFEVFLGIRPDVNNTPDVYYVSQELMRDKIIPDLQRFLLSLPRDNLISYQARFARSQYENAVQNLIKSLEPFEKHLLNQAELNRPSFIEKIAKLVLIANKLQANLQCVFRPELYSLPMQNINEINSIISMYMKAFNVLLDNPNYPLTREFLYLTFRFQQVAIKLEELISAIKEVDEYRYNPNRFFTSEKPDTETKPVNTMPKAKL